MNTEGVGLKKPGTWKLTLTDHDVQTIIEAARRLDKYRRYTARSDDWGKGLKPATVIGGVRLERSERPIVSGKFGEYAVATQLNRSVKEGLFKLDEVLRKGGDGDVDLEAYGLKMQIKTRQHPREICQVRIVTANGRRLRLASDVFVFCEWLGTETVSTLGWMYREELLRREPVDSDFGHQNLEAKDCELLPFQRLIDELRSRKELAE